MIVPQYLDSRLTELKDCGAELGVEFEKPESADPLLNDENLRWVYSVARVLASADDQLAWRTLVELSPRLGDTTLDEIYRAGGETWSGAIRGCSNQNDRLRWFLEQVDATISAAHSLGIPFDDSRDEWIEWLFDQTVALATRLGVPISLAEVIARFSEIRAAEPTVGFVRAMRRGFAPQGHPEGDVETAEPDLESLPSAAVAVTTIHSAKGLEADHVFVINAIEDSFSKVGAADADRLLFVAITRTKSCLYLTAPRRLRGTLLHQVQRGSAAGGRGRPALMTHLLSDPLRRLGIPIESHNSEHR